MKANLSKMSVPVAQSLNFDLLRIQRVNGEQRWPEQERPDHADLLQTAKKR